MNAKYRMNAGGTLPLAFPALSGPHLPVLQMIKTLGGAR